MGPDNENLSNGFFYNVSGYQGFNGYVQQGSGVRRSGVGIGGVGITLNGSAASLTPSSVASGTVSLWRDLGGDIVTNTGDIAKVPQDRGVSRRSARRVYR